MNQIAIIIGYAVIVAITIGLACLLYAIGHLTYEILWIRFNHSRWANRQIAKNRLLYIRDALEYISHRYDFDGKETMNIYQLAEYFRHKEQEQ